MTTPNPPHTKQIDYLIRDIDCNDVAIHHRIEGPDGKKIGNMWWSLPDGTRGLGGLKTCDLPLYGAERLRDLPNDTEVIVTEGEKAAQALIDIGVAAVGTVTGAGGMPTDEVLKSLLPFNIVFWPDNDNPGRTHLDRIAARLRQLGGR